MLTNLYMTLSLVFLLGLPLRAEIILDDFDDPAEIVAPDQLGESVFTESVGFIGASRRLGIGAQQTRPTASLDSNISSASQLTAVMTDLNPLFIGGAPGASLGVSYNEFLVDFTEGGVNNALLFDFSSIAGPTPPAFLSVLVRETTHDGLSFFTRIAALPESNSPFTLVMPFDSFGSRGGGPEGADFQTIHFIGFDFVSNGFFGAPEELGWTVELDRIRVGRIPEPSSIYLLGCGLGVCYVCRRRVLFGHLPFHVAPEAAKGHLEGLGHLLGDADADLHLAKLDLAHVGAMDARQGGKGFLGKPRPFPFLPHDLAKYFLNSLHKRLACQPGVDYSPDDPMTDDRHHMIRKETSR